MPTLQIELLCEAMHKQAFEILLMYKCVIPEDSWYVTTIFKRACTCKSVLTSTAHPFYEIVSGTWGNRHVEWSSIQFAAEIWVCFVLRDTHCCLFQFHSCSTSECKLQVLHMWKCMLPGCKYQDYMSWWAYLEIFYHAINNNTESQNCLFKYEANLWNTMSILAEIICLLCSLKQPF